jgi:hypothetical protein
MDFLGRFHAQGASGDELHNRRWLRRLGLNGFLHEIKERNNLLTRSL